MEYGAHNFRIVSTHEYYHRVEYELQTPRYAKVREQKLISNFATFWTTTIMLRPIVGQTDPYAQNRSGKVTREHFYCAWHLYLNQSLRLDHKLRF